MSARTRTGLIPLLALTLSACGDDDTSLPARVGNALRVSGESPYPSSCGPGAGYRGTEVEPYLAVDPSDPTHLVATWQQDRWSNAGAAGLRTAVSRDGGDTWSVSGPALTLCSGGTAGHGDFERATDPWVVVGTDGVAHLAGFVFDRTSARQAMVTSRSTDGGETWAEPVVVASEYSASVALDKETITVDPAAPGTLYMTWDRLTAQDDPVISHQGGPAWIASSTDGGATWDPPHVVYDPGLDAQTIGGVVTVLPDGTLLELFTVITQMSATTPLADVAVVRSTDGGSQWSAPVIVSSLESIGVYDEKARRPVRSGNVLASIAVDPQSGTVWVAWADSRFSGGVRDAVALSRSDDGGLTWSAPAQVSQSGTAAAFTSVVAVSETGTVAVSYYDLRNDSPSDAAHLRATAWVVRSADRGATWTETQLGEPFDLWRAPYAGGWFLGDYTGLASRAGGFSALFVLTNDSAENPTDAFVASLPAPLVASPRVARR